MHKCADCSESHILYVSTLNSLHWLNSVEVVIGMDGQHQKQKNKYSIIVPTYNERLNIGLIVYLIFKHLR